MSRALFQVDTEIAIDVELSDTEGLIIYEPRPAPRAARSTSTLVNADGTPIRPLTVPDPTGLYGFGSRGLTSGGVDPQDILADGLSIRFYLAYNPPPGEVLDTFIEPWAQTGTADIIPRAKLPDDLATTDDDEGGGGGTIVADVEDGRLPADAVAMRLGWSQSRVFAAGTFTRAEDHPIDGAAEGTSDGLILPPFPPALSTDATLFLGIWIAGDPSVVAIDRSGSIDGEDSLEFFPAADRVALTVDLVDGFYYPNTAREAPPIEGQDDVLSVTLGGGPLIITEDNIGDHAVVGADAVARAQAAAAHAASDAATAAAGAAAAEAEAAQDTADAAGVAATAATEAAATADGKAVAAQGTAVAAQGTADTAEAAAAVNAAAIAALPEGGGDGAPVQVETESLKHTRSTLLYETDSTAFTNAVWADIYEVDGATQIVCPDNGEIEVYAYAKSGLRDDSVAYARFPAADLRLSPTDGPKHIPLGANRWFGIQVNNLADAHIQLKGQDGQDSVNGNYAIRISHITEHTSEVVTGVSGTVGGRTEIFSGAVTYTEQEFDLALEDGDAGKMLRLEMWRQGASDPPELSVLYQASCSVDNWLRSLGGAPSSSGGVLIAGWGDEDESSERNWIRLRPGDTIAKRKTHFRFGSFLRDQAALPDNAKIWLEG